MNDPTGAGGQSKDGKPATQANTATERLVQQLERLVEQSAQPDMRVSLLLRLAKTLEQRAGDPDRALAALGRALAVRPRNRKTLAELERVAGAAEAWPAMIFHWREAADTVESEADRVELQARLARLALDRAGNTDEALSLYESVLTLEPAHEEALRATVELHRQAGRRDELGAALERLTLRLPDAMDGAAFVLELAALAESRGEGPDDAIAAYEQARDSLGDDPRVLEPLSNLYRESGRIDALVDVLEALAAIDPPRQAELRQEAARLCELELDDTDRAIRIYESLVTAESGHAEVLERLSAVYLEREDWDGLARVFERRLEAEQDADERAELCRQLAILYEDAFEDRERAATYYRLLLGQDPDNVSAFENLCRILRLDGRWSDLAETMTRRLARELDDAERRDVLLDLAIVRKEQLDDIVGGIATLDELLALEPSHGRGLALLEELLRASGDTRRLATLLEQRLPLLENPEERAELHKERAETFRLSGQAALAIDAYRAALAEVPADAECAATLIGILEEEQRDEELVDAIEIALQHTDEPEEQADLLYKLAGALRRRGDDDGVTDALERALEAYPRHQEAASALADRFIAEEQWPAAMPLLEILLPELDSEGAPRESAGILRRVGLVAERLGETERAISFWGYADALEPEHGESVAALARLFQSVGRGEDSVMRYRQLLALTEGDARGAGALEAHRAVMVHALENGDDDTADEHAGIVLAAEADDIRALQARADIYERGERYEESVDVRRGLIELAERDGANELRLLKMRMELAERLADWLGDHEGAAALYAEAAEGAPDSRAPLLRLLEFQMGGGRAEAGLETVSKLIALTEDDRQRASYHTIAAQLLRDELDRDLEAIEHLVKAVICDQERLDALQEAEQLMAAHGEWQALSDALEIVADTARTKGRTHLARNLYRRLGEHHVRRTDDLSAAAVAYRQACRLDPDDSELRRRLVEILESAGEHEEALRELQRLISIEPERAELWRASAHLFEQSGRPGGANSALGVLSILGQLEETEKEKLDGFRPPRMSDAQVGLSRDSWMRIVAPDELGTPLGVVMKLLYENLADSLQTATLKSLGLRRGDELEPEQDLLFLRTLNATARVLGVAVPRVFYDEGAKGLRVLPLHPPTLAIGPGLLKGRFERELAFIIGKALVYTQPEWALAAMFPAAALRSLVECALAYARPEMYTPPVDGTLRRRADAVVKAIRRKMPSDAGARLRAAAVSSRGESVEQWVGALARTANRVGLLCSGDVPVAGKLCGRPLTQEAPPLETGEAVLDLAFFSISDRYLKLRRRLWTPA